MTVQRDFKARVCGPRNAARACEPQRLLVDISWTSSRIVNRDRRFRVRSELGVLCQDGAR